MKVLITGSNGFVGRNLVENLKNIKYGKNTTRPNLSITEIFEYDRGSTLNELDSYCKQADFVFNLVGVNRPKNQSEFMNGNFGFASQLLDLLKKHNNICPVMLSSSLQASLVDRFENSEYGKSKLAGEDLFFKYGKETGAKVLVYRFPNLFGKWCRPNYNSVVATFCDAIANNKDYTVNDSAAKLELLYIDDLVEGMFDALEGKERRCVYSGLELIPLDHGEYSYVPGSYMVTLGEIVDFLKSFKNFPENLVMPCIPDNTFEKKLFSTYLSYVPKESVTYDLDMKADHRGVFTELLKTESNGQISINIAGPGITRGEHWHNSKWEIFMVVSGHGLIRERRIGKDPETGENFPVVNIEVRGEQMKAVQMLPGYAHSITNLSNTENLVTIMWANEQFNKSKPDTFSEKVSDPS